MHHGRAGRHRRERGWLPTSLLVAGLLGLWPVPAAGRAPIPPEPAVLSTDAAGVVLEWRAPAFSLRQVSGEDGRPYSAVEAPGWAQIEQPGQPRLPLASALAIVPPTGEVTMRIQTLEGNRRSLPHPVVPARAPVGNPPTDVEWIWARDEQIYAQAGLYPADVVLLEEAGWMRGRRLVRLTFYPLRFDPATNALEVTRLVRVELRFQGNLLDAAQGETASESEWARGDPFTPVLENSVVNPAQATRFARPERVVSVPSTALRAGPSAPLGADPTVPAGAGVTSDGNPRYKLIVSREGVYALTYGTLVGAGIPVTTNPRTAYRLEHAAEEVTYQWEGDDDAAFEPGERILFYARPTLTRFADYDVYWLTVGATGAQMGTRPGNPGGLSSATAWTTAAAEQDRNYLSLYPSGRNGDRWYWDRLYWDYTTGSGEREKDLSITLAAPQSGAANATLRVYLQGTTRNDTVNPDHRLQVWLNGGLLGVAEWDGAIYRVATFHVPASLLQAGGNTVRLRLPGSNARSGVEEVWLDALELRYGVGSVSGGSLRVEGEAGRNAYTLNGFTSDEVHVYDVTSPIFPQVVTSFDAPSGSVTFGDVDAGTATYYLLTEAQIAAPDEIVRALTLPDPPAGADYLIIAHSSFIAAVAPLAAHRAASDGLRVFSTTVEAVYDAYSGGVVTPTAIKDYIKHAYDNWAPPRLSYVLLVGDGTDGPLTHSQTSAAHLNFIPPFMIDLFGDEAASDNRYVTVDGEDNLADVFIGRLPVENALQATAIVNKILAYELNPPQWPWNERVLFFAGHESDDTYHGYSDEVYYNHLPNTFVGRRMYFCTSGCSEPHEYDDITVAHNTTMHELNAGGLLASYVGHSSVHQWDWDPVTYAPLFHWDDVAGLHNGGALPVLLEMTCYTSQFSYPDSDTLDESLVRQAGGGTVATWGSTTWSVAQGNRILHAEFFDAVFQEGTTMLGAATETAKGHLPPNMPYLHDTFILFGDPAMHLNLNIVPWAHEVFLPATLRNK